VLRPVPLLPLLPLLPLVVPSFCMRSGCVSFIYYLCLLFVP
jgi:hypothetical protein